MRARRPAGAVHALSSGRAHPRAPEAAGQPLEGAWPTTRTRGKEFARGSARGGAPREGYQTLGDHPLHSNWP